ncbi:MAG: YegP family protein [Pseudomonas sp.]
MAGNGEMLGRSKMHSSTAVMENGIAQVKVNAPTGPVTRCEPWQSGSADANWCSWEHPF